MVVTACNGDVNALGKRVVGPFEFCSRFCSLVWYGRHMSDNGNAVAAILPVRLDAVASAFESASLAGRKTGVMSSSFMGATSGCLRGIHVLLFAERGCREAQPQRVETTGSRFFCGRAADDQDEFSNSRATFLTPFLSHQIPTFLTH